jgi:SAM-dependent methyltransferase
MFAPDIVNLRQFYTTPLGEAARLLISKSVQAIWPKAQGDKLLGLGFPTPYMEPHLDSGSPLFVCMPAAQGAVYWPPARTNLVFLAHESQLPLPSDSVNRVLLVHSIEHSEELSWMMREVWRVLVPGGRVLAVVPNRMSFFWSRSSRSPFGYGRPFTMMQLRTLFTGHQFTPIRSSVALFTPPLYWRWLWRISGKIEAVGKIIFRPFGGVLILEAEKQVYAAIKQPLVARKEYRPVRATTPALSR